MNLWILIAIFAVTVFPRSTWQYCFRDLNFIDKCWDIGSYWQGNNIGCKQENNISVDFLEKIEKITPQGLREVCLFVSDSQISLMPTNAFHSDITFSGLKIEAHVKEIEPEAFNANALRYLSLRNNLLTVVRKHYFSGLVRLQYLDLSFNTIVSIEKGSFDDLDRLNFLNLTHNFLKDSSLPGLFVNLNSLITLDLSYNLIETVNSELLQGLKMIQNMFFDNNQLTFFDGYVLANKFFLTKVSISNNILRSINNVTILNSLSLLNVSHNVIPEINFIGMPDVKALDLSFNKLNKLSLGNIRLVEICLDRNHLGPNAVNSNTFASQTSLKKVSIANSRITHLDYNLFQNNQQLYQLDLHNDSLNSDDIPALPVSVTFLDLSCNNLDSNLKLKNLTKLYSLNLSLNNLTQIKFDFFKNLISLKNIDLSNNQIVDLSIGCFRDLNNLATLNLSMNLISTLKVGVFTGLNKLQTLDLSYNRLKVLKEGVFINFRNLIQLRLTDNKINYSNLKNAIEHLRSSIQYIFVGGNGLSCNSLLDLVKSGVILTIGRQNLDVLNVDGIACQFEEKEETEKLLESETKTFTNLENKLQTIIVLICVIMVFLIFAKILKYGKMFFDRKLKTQPATRRQEQELLVLDN